MKVFISYHRADAKYRRKVEDILRSAEIDYYAVPEDADYDGQSHQHIKDKILQEMDSCDILLCIVGRDTYTRPHIDWELHEALKGGVHIRKGILAVMLENRQDNKNDINYETFPNRLQDNEEYIVIEQYASLQDRLIDALHEAENNKNDSNIQIINKRKLLQLRSAKYYDIN